MDLFGRYRLQLFHFFQNVRLLPAGEGQHCRIYRSGELAVRHCVAGIGGHDVSVQGILFDRCLADKIVE